MTQSSIFADQADLPPTTERPVATMPNPYARRQSEHTSAAKDLVFDEKAGYLSELRRMACLPHCMWRMWLLQR